MSNFWMFALVVALVVGWFVLDRPVEPGEPITATIADISPINVPSGAPQSKLVAKLADGALVTLQIARNDALGTGANITLQRYKRRLSGTASYEFVK